MCLSIPPKYAVATVVGFIKGKSAIHIARRFGGRRRDFMGENFWARGNLVSTVGLDEEMVRAYIRNQEAEDELYNQMKFGTIVFSAALKPPDFAGGYLLCPVIYMVPSSDNRRHYPLLEINVVKLAICCGRE
jgi:putative transposase